MKNSMNITLGNINLVIEGQPVVLENIQLNYENEASVQELAAGASFIKDLVGEIKDMIKEAQASAAQHAYDQYPKVEVKAAEPKVAEAKEVNYRINLKGTFEVLEGKLNGEDAWKSDGFGNLVYEKDDTNVAIHLKNEKIQIDIHVNDNHYHLHVYEDHMYISGFSAVYAEKFFKELKVYGATDIWDLIKKVNKEED